MEPIGKMIFNAALGYINSQNLQNIIDDIIIPYLKFTKI